MHFFNVYRLKQTPSICSLFSLLFTSNTWCWLWCQSLVLIWQHGGWIPVNRLGCFQVSMEKVRSLAGVVWCSPDLSTSSLWCDWVTCPCSSAQTKALPCESVPVGGTAGLRLGSGPYQPWWLFDSDRSTQCPSVCPETVAHTDRPVFYVRWDQECCWVMSAVHWHQSDWFSRLKRLL